MFTISNTTEDIGPDAYLHFGSGLRPIVLFSVELLFGSVNGNFKMRDNIEPFEQLLKMPTVELLFQLELQLTTAL